MTLLNGLIGLVSVGFLLFVVGLQVMIRRRSAAMAGAPVPVLPGPLGERVAATPHALVYFFSQHCAACRAITPKVRALEAKAPGIFLVDVAQELDLARALGVMATPSTIEITGGRITGCHLGPIPEAVWARFQAPEPG